MYVKFMKINETRNWGLDPWMTDKIKAIWGCYVFIPSRQVYCCEMTPSYECHSLPSQVEFIDDDYMSDHEREREEIEMCVMEGDSSNEQVSYYHCHSVDAMPSFKLGWFPKGLNGVCRDSGYATHPDIYDTSDERTKIEQLQDEAIEEALEFERTSCI